MVINGREFTPEIIDRIQELVKSEPLISRTQLSRQVCEWLGWRNAIGKLQDMSCRVALLKLSRQGLIALPVGGVRPPQRSKGPVMTEGEAVVEKTVPMECRLPDLGRIELIKIGSAESKNSRIWNELMRRYHYLGDGPLCGAQMRYLIRSERYDFIGGFAFSAAAWKIAPRDQWIGWDAMAHKKNLNKVIGNSRFLIVPRVAHLASHVLALMVKRIAPDWQERYGMRPVLLETFIEQGRFKGTCYQAANWRHLGETRGRGRQDSACLGLMPVKDIYVYPLDKQTCKILCDGGSASVLKSKVDEDWAQEEFGGVALRDRRLVKRLVTLAHDFGEQPQSQVPQACGTRAKTKAAYRFFEHERVTMETLLKPHYESTLNRLHQEKTVLAVQDTTTLNYSAHPATKDLGLIDSHAKGAIGLLLHDTLVFNPEGTPLGLLDIQCWARDPALFGKNHLRKKLPIEEKESYKWIKSFKAVVEAQKRCPKTRLISMGDREADIYDLFTLALSDPSNPLVLVRAQHDRLLSDGQVHVWPHVARQPLAGIREVKISRRGHQKARTARLEIRFARVALNPPQLKPHLESVTIWAVMAQEIDAPDGVTPLIWMLLSTYAVNHFEQALEVVDWYRIRFGIEIYHKTLKSGCRIEKRQLCSAERLKACLAIDLVVAWRVFWLTKLGREVPEVPCTVFFEEDEWKALVAHKTQTAIPPIKPPSLREALQMTASLGGFLGRKGDGEPGTKTLWIGLQRLDDIVLGWRVVISTFAPHLLPPVSRVPRYG